jgi:undecaprenyl-diphosphatase
VSGGATERRGFYARWLSPEGYLGLHLVVGFLVALATGLVFNYIRDEVFEAPATIAVDMWAEHAVERVRTPELTSVLSTVTLVGNTATLAALSVGVGIVLAARRSHRRLAMLAATMVGGSLLNLLLKTHFQRARPSEIPSLVHATGYSFPSGHSMGSMLFFGALAYVVYFSFDGHQLWRLAAVVLCAVLVLLVGLSRVYLGVHYLSDVAAGFAGGLFWIGVCLSGTEAWVRLRDWRRARQPAADA